MSPLFGRGKEKDTVPQTPALGAITGELHCSTHGCTREDAAQCAYVDSNARHCDVAACALHQTIIHGTCYCVRHANTVVAMDLWDASGAEARLRPEQLTHLPEIGNRTPNLVYWVCNAIDQEVRELLEAKRAPEGGELVRHPVRAHGRGWNRVWASGWSVAGVGGRNLDVQVGIEDDNRTEVVVTVGDKEVAKGVPPWVRRHERFVRADPETDERERREYFAGLIAAIAEALTEIQS